MIKRFFLGLLKFIVVLAVCVAVGSAAVYYIYNEYAIDPQILIDEYEEIAQEKEIVLPTPAPSPDADTDTDAVAETDADADAQTDANAADDAAVTDDDAVDGQDTQDDT